MRRAVAVGIVMTLLAGCRSVVLSGYGTRTGTGRAHGGNPEFRRHAHRGVDFRADARGAPVLAAAGGLVVEVSSDRWGNTSVLIEHARFDRWTRYYYRGTAQVERGAPVRRGQVIGETAAQPAKGTSLAHVHLELCTAWTCTGAGPLGGTEDPLGDHAGCFRGGTEYPRDRLVLSYPIRC